MWGNMGATSKAKRTALPGYERVRECFDYDPHSGALIWRVSGARMRAGEDAGVVRPDGQILVGLDGGRYRSHRLIWLWMTGDEPPEYIDHADGDRGNNRWGNLREASNSLNMANRGAQKNNRASGLKGAYANNGVWMSRIQKDGVDYYLGCFSSPEEAHAAYAAKATELFGEFARVA